jgi:hypothetical protein
MENYLSIIKASGTLEVTITEPEKNLYYFRGRVSFGKGTRGEDVRTQDVDLRQFLHSGTILKNSEAIVALVLYCGPENKIVLN